MALTDILKKLDAINVLVEEVRTEAAGEELEFINDDQITAVIEILIAEQLWPLKAYETFLRMVNDQGKSASAAFRTLSNGRRDVTLRTRELLSGDGLRGDAPLVTAEPAVPEAPQQVAAPAGAPAEPNLSTPPFGLAVPMQQQTQQAAQPPRKPRGRPKKKVETPA